MARFSSPGIFHRYALSGPGVRAADSVEKICFAAPGLPSGTSAEIWISPSRKEDRRSYASRARYDRARITWPGACANGKAEEATRRPGLGDICGEGDSSEGAHARAPENGIYVRRTIDSGGVHGYHSRATGVETLSSSFRCART